MTMMRILAFSLLIVLGGAQFCPEPAGVGICISGCQRNPDKTDSCTTAGQKCCSNGCGQTCQDEAKCPLGKPLADDSGKEIFCGRGINAQRCPVGYACHIHPTDMFAVCCRCPPVHGCRLTCQRKRDTLGCEICECEDLCENVACPVGQACILQPVQCITTPCYPQPTCKPKGDVCKQPMKKGTCKGAFRRYYYDYGSGKCTSFTYGGCEANLNNFFSMEQCRSTCGGYDETCPVGGPLLDASLKRYRAVCGTGVGHVTCPNDYYCSTGATPACCSVCALPVLVGGCSDSLARFYYDPASQLCKPFTYTGCSGNQNNFASLQDCQNICSNFCADKCATAGNDDFHRMCGCADPCREETCSRGQECVIKNIATTPTAECVDICSLNGVTGPCQNSPNYPAYYYDDTTKKCDALTYSGCGGNKNNFPSLVDCKNSCEERVCPGNKLPLSIGGQTVVCGSNSDCPDGHGCNTARADASSICCECPVIQCTLGCPLMKDRETGCDICRCGGDPCKNHGCGQDVCIMQDVQCFAAPCTPIAVCLSRDEVCTQPVTSGPCAAYMPMFAYNQYTGDCDAFIYGGCEGNDNRFLNKEHCINTCRPDIAQQDPVCKMAPDISGCVDATSRHYYDPITNDCRESAQCGGSSNAFLTEDDCESKCKLTIPKYNPEAPDLCDLPKKRGPCSEVIGKYYHNSQFKKCVTFIFGGCEGNTNAFNSRKQCERRCSGGASLTYGARSSQVALVLIFSLITWYI